MITTAIAVFIGGGLGSLARWGVGRSMSDWAHPHAALVATLAANALACLVLGFFLSKAPNARQVAWIAIGFCGGFSTFSTFSQEVLTLFKTGQWVTALCYAVASMAIGLAALYRGSRLT